MILLGFRDVLRLPAVGLEPIGDFETLDFTGFLRGKIQKVSKRLEIVSKIQKRKDFGWCLLHKKLNICCMIFVCLVHGFW